MAHRTRARIGLMAFLGLAAALAAPAARAAPELTPTERRWIELGTPVLRYALDAGLPLDIAVEPGASAGRAPIALGYVDGRCKLVLAMRGNPAAQATLDGVDAALLGPVVEAMTAHELGHCWRYVHGTWHTVPAGFVAAPAPEADADDARRAELRREMRETRLEEGYADLVGLAWTAARHPAQYAAVHDWLARLREAEPVAGGHHDTRAWVRLARERDRFDAAATPFAQAQALWKRGLEAD